MNLKNLIIKSIWYFRKQHMAVLLGTIISTAVLTGALIIGDSVRLSLQKLVDLRLGNTEFALQTGDRFVSDSLVTRMEAKLNAKATGLLNANAIALNQDSGKRIHKTNVWGVDESFWEMNVLEVEPLKKDEVYLNEKTAEKLQLKVGDEFLLKLEKLSLIPVNAPFTSEEESSVSMRLAVKAILSKEQMGRFSLKSDQKGSYNIFVNKKEMARRLELAGKVNTILLGQNEHKDLNQEKAQNTFHQLWSLEDAALKLNQLSPENLELVSDRVFIDNPVSAAINSIGSQHKPVLTYLVNSMRNKEGKSVPYSFVGASKHLVGDLKADEIVVNTWLQKELKLKIGDSLKLDYYVIGALRTLEEKSKSFVIKDICEVENEKLNASLMPSFPGMSDAGSCSEWETGIPIDLDLIRDKDEDYWDAYRGTPKAYVSLATGLNLWANPYGDYTSIRFSNMNKAELEEKLTKTLKPQDLGMYFQEVRGEGHRAATSGVDFGELFVSMSFFVIAGAVLLMVLLYALNVQSRQAQLGLYGALGFSKNKIQRIQFLESGLVIGLGAILGSVLGVFYNQAIMWGLNSIWQDIVRTQQLEMFVLPKTIIIGALSGAFMALVAVYFILRKKLKLPFISLLKGSSINLKLANKRSKQLSLWIGLSSILGSVIIPFSLGADSLHTNSGLYLSMGALFLLGASALVKYTFVKTTLNTARKFTQAELFFKNASRNQSRSMASIVLLALGTFTIIITGANRNSFYGLDNERSSGTGGYTYWAETAMPVLNDLNTKVGKEKVGIEDALMDSVEFMQFPRLEGDDASCLNLNQVSQPAILGVDAKRLRERGSFSFAAFQVDIDAKNIWAEFNKDYGTNVIPAIADQTVITWGIMKKLGDTLYYKNEAGEELKLVLVAGLNASVFQGHLLISQEAFRKQFPSKGGSSLMLVDAQNSDQAEVQEYLNDYMVDYGLELEKNTERLASFYSVTNTYLTVFMILGGLGVMIGSLGLGVILVRNLMERKHELALLKAVGFQKKQIQKIVFRENLLLLSLGMGIGILSALIGILPSIVSPAYSFPGFFMIVLVLVVFITGLLSICFPLRKQLAGDLLAGLRRE